MSTFQETVSMRVNDDFVKFQEILSNKLNISMLKDYHIQSLKNLHKYLYIYKEILNELPLLEEAKSLAFDSFNGSMEFLICLIQGKYKLASMVIRGSMETYAKSLVLTTPVEPTTKFSNNIEISLKNMTENICNSESLNFRLCKELKKTVNSTYADVIKKEYWELSDIVHSRTTTYNSCSEFLDDVLIIKFDESIFNLLLDKCNNIIKYFIEIIVLVNYKNLDSKMNYLAFEYITGNLSENFKNIKNVYI
ncbi:hypothetical protein ABNX05_24355 [Lysinibacillus sp. M3]|uniref:DUF2935 domain-containing protein n=1 Tax=Lysinibacillus zambalensis TaxID=3160866 RepID=A0ABV1MZ11_9BACI